MLFLFSAAATPEAISGWYKYWFESRGGCWFKLSALPAGHLTREVRWPSKRMAQGLGNACGDR